MKCRLRLILENLLTCTSFVRRKKKYCNRIHIYSVRVGNGFVCEVDLLVNTLCVRVGLWNASALLLPLPPPMTFELTLL